MDLQTMMICSQLARLSKWKKIRDFTKNFDFTAVFSDPNTWPTMNELGCPKDWIPIDFPDNHGLKLKNRDQLTVRKWLIDLW